MAYPNRGFTYVRGPIRGIDESTISSGVTFKAGNPVSYGLGGVIKEMDSNSTAIFGIAQNDAALSFAGRPGVASVMVPTVDTVFSSVIATNVAASSLSAGMVWGVVKSGNYWRFDPTSRTTPAARIIARENGSTIDSADSSIWISFLPNFLVTESATSLAFNA